MTAMNGENRGPWYLITALIIGLSTGLLYSWKLAPVQYIDTAPASLREDYKTQYRVLVAAAYASNGDLARAQARLNQLGEKDIAQVLTKQAQQALADGHPQSEAQALGLLALAISQGASPTMPPPPDTSTPTPQPSFTPSPTEAPVETTLLNEPGNASTPIPPQTNLSNTPTVRPTSTILAPIQLPSITPLPSRTPTPTQGAPFVLKQSVSLVCNPNLSRPLIMVEASDAAGGPVPGVQVIVRWGGNEDRFFTGLKPELGLGYGDFSMTPGIEYTVQIAEGGQPISGLAANECETLTKERYWGSWRLIFVQP